MRINKYIAQAGFTSRRKADELIINGNVKVNGKIMKEPGYQVEEDDRVSVNEIEIHGREKLVYIALNKPMGYVTTMDDDRNRYIVTDLISDIPERVFPVGRLDFNTTGLLLMTNDGDLGQKLMHPSHKMTKRYRAHVAGVLSGQKEAIIRKGVDIGGYITKPAKVEVIKQGPRSAIVEIEIHEGKNRQVRKMFNALDCPVQSLKRVAIGKVQLGKLKEGHYRKLSKEEISYLKGERDDI